MLYVVQHRERGAAYSPVKRPEDTQEAPTPPQQQKTSAPTGLKFHKSLLRYLLHLTRIVNLIRNRVLAQLLSNDFALERDDVADRELELFERCAVARPSGADVHGWLQNGYSFIDDDFIISIREVVRHCRKLRNRRLHFHFLFRKLQLRGFFFFCFFLSRRFLSRSSLPIFSYNFTLAAFAAFARLSSGSAVSSSSTKAASSANAAPRWL